jgi:hypothetical protein
MNDGHADFVSLTAHRPVITEGATDPARSLNE